MAIGFGEGISKFVPGSKREVSSSAQPAIPSVVFGHERLFHFYGIPYELLNPSLKIGITRLETGDGDLCIDWEKRTIIPPLKYFLHKSVL